MAVKAVRFNYAPREDVLDLLKTFRIMVNEALRIGFEKKPKTRFQLITMGTSTSPRNYIIIPLKGGEYQLSFLRDPALKRGSITITDSTVILAVRKTAKVVEPLRKAVAYDVNEKNVTSSNDERYDLSYVANIKHQYSRIRASIANNTHKDRRVKQRLLSKYGRREKARTVQVLHRVSKTIVENALKARSPIVLEKLTNIRRFWIKGNGQGRKMRGRLNKWNFRELQRQIEYKAKWEGLPVEYVRASMTSKQCSQCGCINKALKYEREWQCPTCGAILDRDLNASINILAKSRFKEPSAVHSVNEGLTGEGMVLHEAITGS
jgi:putative transposase